MPSRKRKSNLTAKVASQIGSPPNNLRDVREEIGLSQARLAKWLGVTTIYIQKIEGGDRPISERFAETAALRLGVDKDSFLEPDRILRGNDGKPYSRKHFECAKRIIDRSDLDQDQAEKAALMVKWLFMATGGGKKHTHLSMEFQRWHGQRLKDLRLQTKYDEIAQHCKTEELDTYPLYEFRHSRLIRYGRKIAAFENNPPLSDSLKKVVKHIKTQIESTPGKPRKANKR